jgi:sortase A
MRSRSSALMARASSTQLDVLDKRDTWVARNEGPSRLTLITCWPFDALRAGGAERYVVIAEPLLYTSLSTSQATP